MDDKGMGAQGRWTGRQELRVLAFTVIVAAVALGSCSDEFMNCRETHTCPRIMGDGGEAGGGAGEGSETSASGASGKDATGSGGDRAHSPEGGDGGTGEQPVLCGGTAKPARLIAPLSTSLVTNRVPTLTWELGDDCGPLTVELCRDRACDEVIAQVQVAEDEQTANPEADLPMGTVFWRVRGSGTSSTVWQFNVGVGSPVDTSWGTFPDFNGDGFGDVAVGTSNGTVYVYYGNQSGLEDTPTELSIEGGSAFAFGWLMASAGDVNGDGFGDLLIGAAKLPNGGEGSKVYLYGGGSDGIVVEPFAIIDHDQLLHNGDPQYPGTGSVLRGGADINHDGFGDFVITAPAPQNVANSFSVFLGGSEIVMPSDPVYAPPNTAEFGRSIAFCDVGGDGFPDLVVGVPGGGSTPVAVYEGTGAGFALSQQLPADKGFGMTVACGDYAHDGYPDVATAWPTSDARGYQNGDIWLYTGNGVLSTTGVSLPNQGNASYSESGRLMATVGDMNGDGVQELVVGEYSSSEVRLFFNPGSSKVSDTVAVGTTTISGDALSSADINGDGLADLVVGSSQHGRVSVFLGSKTSRVVTPTMIQLEAPEGALDFGQTLAAAL